MRKKRLAVIAIIAVVWLVSIIQTYLQFVKNDDLIKTLACETAAEGTGASR